MAFGTLKHALRSSALGSSLCRLAADCRGISMVITAIAAPVAVGFAGLAVDVGYWYMESTKLQNAADAAAAGAAQALRQGLTNDEIVAAARRDAELFDVNHGQNATVSVTVDQDDGGVGVSIRQKSKQFFSAVFMDDAPTLGADANAILTQGIPTCVLALNPDPDGEIGIHLETSAQIHGPECAVHSNSRHYQSTSGAEDSSIFVRNGEIRAKRVCAAGNAVADDRGTSVIDPTPRHGCREIQDPFEELIDWAPHVGACDYHNKEVKGGNSRVTLQPGVYCGGLHVRSGAPVVFEPGLYIIKDGDFELEQHAKVDPVDGITIYLTGDPPGRFWLDNNTGLHFRAPTSGNQAGILLWQEKHDPVDCAAPNRMEGNASFVFDGLIYAPGCPLEISNNAQLFHDGVEGYMRVVVDSIYLHNQGTLTIHNTTGPWTMMGFVDKVRLVR